MDSFKVFIAVALMVGPLLASPVYEEHKEAEVEHYAPPKYEFKYGVRDEHTHDIKEQAEKRDGDNVEGYYTLVEPDGTTRTVHYSSDKHSGFTAQVQKTGHSVHPAQVHKQVAIAPVIAHHQPVHAAPVIAHQPVHIAAPVIAHHAVAPAYAHGGFSSGSSYSQRPFPSYSHGGLSSGSSYSQTARLSVPSYSQGGYSSAPSYAPQGTYNAQHSSYSQHISHGAPVYSHHGLGSSASYSHQPVHSAPSYSHQPSHGGATSYNNFAYFADGGHKP